MQVSNRKLTKYKRVRSVISNHLTALSVFQFPSAPLGWLFKKGGPVRGGRWLTRAWQSYRRQSLAQRAEGLHCGFTALPGATEAWWVHKGMVREPRFDSSCRLTKTTAIHKNTLALDEYHNLVHPSQTWLWNESNDALLMWSWKTQRDNWKT